MIQIPLAELAREAGRKRSTTLRPTVPTQSLASDLFSIYADSIAIWRQLASRLATEYEQPGPVTTDADGAQIQWLIDQAATRADQTLIYQTERLGRWVTRVGDWHGNRTISSVKSALGIDIKPYMRLSDIRPQLEDAIRENVSLLRSINADMRAKVEAIIFDGLANRRNKKYVTDELAKAMGITKRRARRIANDQTHKLSINLTSLRNQQLGIETYIWQTREDDRVRPVHRRRNGHVFRWDAPPWDGHPGHAINCRCIGRPVVEI